MRRGFVSYILAHIGLILLGIAAIFSICALCGPHWNDGNYSVGTGKDKKIFLGLWQTCATFDYEYFFYYRLNDWTYCINSHGWDTVSEILRPFNQDGVIAAAATTLIAFICLVLGVLVGVPYMFFYFRGFSRWLIAAVSALCLLGCIFHVIGLFVWGLVAWQQVLELWGRSPHNYSLNKDDFWWGWAFILAICATILAFFAFILTLIAVLFHKPDEIFLSSRETVHTTSTIEKRKIIVSEGRVHDESRTSSKINYKM